MQVGYNTNISFRGKKYHVQTEDTGLESLQIVSLLYCEGAILTSRKISYEHLKDFPDLITRIRTMMKEQHRNLIRDLLRGGCTPGEVPAASLEEASAGEKKHEDARTLDDILIDFIMRQTHNA